MTSDAVSHARAMVSGWISSGLRDVVVCPGSRSAPLAFAVWEAAGRNQLRLHVRADERAAAFLALGLGLGDPRRPAAVITTSGTAVANLHPAVLEAWHAGVPLLVATANRPPALRGTWANQTSEHQNAAFGQALRGNTSLVADGFDRRALWRTLGAKAVTISVGATGSRPGPVHLDLGFSEPLVPRASSLQWPPSPSPSTSSSPSSAIPPRGAQPAASTTVPWRQHTVVVAGDKAGPAAERCARAGGWPLFAEPSSGALPSDHAIPGYPLLLETAAAQEITCVIAFGHPTLSRPVTRLLSRPEVELIHVATHPGAPGPPRPHTSVLGRVTVGAGRGQADAAGGDGEWLGRWQRLGAAAAKVIATDYATGSKGLSVAAALIRATAPTDALVVAASNPVRDMDLAAHQLPRGALVVANRGLAGIDGTVSTAVGVARSSGRRTRVFVGDLAFLHDLNGLLAPPRELETTCVQVVVLNDDGGGIFELLEPAEQIGSSGFDRDGFERIFSTPHGADVGALCAGYRVRHEQARSSRALDAALGAVSPGLSVVEVPSSRTSLPGQHRQLLDAVRRAVTAVEAPAR